jgi:hypothetical protein
MSIKDKTNWPPIYKYVILFWFKNDEAFISKNMSWYEVVGVLIVARTRRIFLFQYSTMLSLPQYIYSVMARYLLFSQTGWIFNPSIH